MRNYTLYVKFNALIVGTIFICGLLTASLFLYSTSEYMSHELDASGKELAVSIGQVVSNDILVDDRFDMTEQLLHAQKTNDQVRYILVTYPDGRILASTFTEGLPKGLPERRDLANEGLGQTLTFDSTEGYIREIMVPIDGGLVGYFRVGLSERPMMQLMWKRFVETMLIILAICLVASALATRYARSFLRPVQALAKAIRQIGRGNYSVRVSVDTKDDVGQLAKAFNVMSNRLAVKDRENSKLLTALREKEKNRVWLIDQLFSAREDERRRISRELHDETSQSMVSILAYLRLIQDQTEKPDVRELVTGVRDLTRETLEGLRHLAVNVHPPLLDDLGLIVAIEKYLDTYRQTQPDLTVSFCHDGDISRVSRPVALFCYRMVQEGLTNIARHAQAHTVTIELNILPSALSLVIADDGVGFSAARAEQARLDNHLGLVSMQERTDVLNGTFSIDGQPGKGTTLTITLPLHLSEEMEHEHTIG